MIALSLSKRISFMNIAIGINPRLAFASKVYVVENAFVALVIILPI